MALEIERYPDEGESKCHHTDAKHGHWRFAAETFPESTAHNHHSHLGIWKWSEKKVVCVWIAIELTIDVDEHLMFEIYRQKDGRTGCSPPSWIGNSLPDTCSLQNTKTKYFFNYQINNSTSSLMISLLPLSSILFKFFWLSSENLIIFYHESISGNNPSFIMPGDARWRLCFLC